MLATACGKTRTHSCGCGASSWRSPALPLHCGGAAQVSEYRFSSFLAFCTATLAFAIFYACYRWAPYSMGLSGPSISAADLNAFMCLSRDATGTAGMWTVIVLACSAAVGLVAWAPLRSRNAAIRAGCYIAAVLALLVAIAGGFLWFFGFSFCSSQRLL